VTEDQRATTRRNAFPSAANDVRERLAHIHTKHVVSADTGVNVNADNTSNEATASLMVTWKSRQGFPTIQAFRSYCDTRHLLWQLIGFFS
jgi:hypothetical protein